MASTLEELGIERYEIVEVKRSQINPAVYNPRRIEDAARSRLGKGLDKAGLVEPIVWNKRTGVLVGGHQRLAIIDKRVAKQKGKDFDYTLRVSAIDVNEIEEKAINALLNNPKAQGEYDIDGLQALMASPGIDVEMAGFDAADSYRLFGHETFDAMSGLESDAATEGGGHGAGEADGPMDREATQKARESLGKLRESIADFDRRTKETNERTSPDFYFLVVFRTAAERDQWLAHLQLEPNKYQSATELTGALQRHGVPTDTGSASADSDTSDSE